MIDAFQSTDILDEEIKITMVDQHGNGEMGEDICGIFREAISSFWKEFYLTCTLGERERIPVLRHDFKEQQWMAVARIMVKGFTDLGYFPLLLSKAFLIDIFHEERKVPSATIISSFCQYVAKDEEDVIKDAMSPETSSLIDNEELLKILSRFDCRKVPNPSNIKTLLTEVAHKELIQKLRYITDSWVPIIRKGLADTKLGTIEGLTAEFELKQPSTRKVIALLRSETTTPAERQTFAYLKQLIRGMDNAQLGTFLMFTTGTDIICIDAIHVQYTTLTGFARRPVAHICGCISELPLTYDTYAEFRGEISNVLAAGKWQNDII